MLPTPVPTQHPLLTAPLHWRFLMHAQMCQGETTGQKGVQKFPDLRQNCGMQQHTGNFLAEEGWFWSEEHFPYTSLESSWLSCQNHKASLSSWPHS